MQELHVKWSFGTLLPVPDKCTVDAIHASPTVHAENGKIKSLPRFGTKTMGYSIVIGMEAVQGVVPIDHCACSCHVEFHMISDLPPNCVL